MLSAVLLGACSTTPPPEPAPPATPVVAIDPTVLDPGEHLHAEGVPPVPKALAERIGGYPDVEAVDVVAWHPNRRTLLVASRVGATTQLQSLDRPMGTLVPLTALADPVRVGSFEPKHGDYLVYVSDHDGDEATQLYRHDFATGRNTLLTDPSRQHALGAWNHAGTALVMVSKPLDRMADAAKRTAVTSDLVVLDPLHPEAARRVASLPGGGWSDFRWSGKDQALYASDRRSATDRVVWKIDVEDGTRNRVLPAPRKRLDPAHPVAYGDLHLTRDGKRLVYTSDEDGEFRQMMVTDLATGRRRVLTKSIPWDVDAIVLQGEDAVDDDRSHHDRARRELACAVVDVAGRHDLHVFDVDTGHEIALPVLPASVRSGSVSRVRFARAGDRDELAFTVESARSPGDVWTLALSAGRAARVEAWTRAVVDGVDASAWRPADVVQWKSFDGRIVSGRVHRPPARFAGPRPVLVDLHDGPGKRATVGFLGRNAYLVDELGVAYIEPDVRGSSGYGKTFRSLDDGPNHEDAVRDVGALLDWISTQPDLDATRVIVAGDGGSPGLAVAKTYPDRIAASIDGVGLASDRERTGTDRRDLRRTGSGDERDPAASAFPERSGPSSSTDRIRKPLFVVAGRNDPHVPYQAVEQIVAKVRAAGVPVWFLVADDEGHGFARKPDADYQFDAQVLFVQRYLLPPAP